MTEQHKKESKKKVAVKKSDFWRTVSIILALLLIISIFTAGFGIWKPDGKQLTAEAAAAKAINYLNSYALQPGMTASLLSVEEKNNLYSVRIEVAGIEYDSYLTKDGKLLFPSALDLEDTSVSPPTTTGTTQTAPTAEVSADDDAVKGESNAPVTIIEFSDFQCPFCARFWRETLPQIQEEYIDTGKVRLVYRDFPLSFHANAQKAAEAAECAEEQDKFWEMHDKIYENQQAIDVSDLKSYAAQLGLDTAAFNNCLDSGKYEDEVNKDFQDGQAAGVSGTPAFFINGKLLVGAQPFSAFKSMIDAELE